MAETERRDEDGQTEMWIVRERIDQKGTVRREGLKYIKRPNSLFK